MRVVPFLLCAAACAGGGEPVSIAFSAVVDGAPFSCGDTYDGIGTSAVAASFTDARWFVHDVVLKDADGKALTFTLDEDAFQSSTVALVDLEDSTGACGDNGSAATHAEVTGTVKGGKPASLSFSVGVPQDENHLDAATAGAPLNQPGMFWAWQQGYKFAKIDASTDANEALFFHLGSTDCDGTPAAGFSCAFGHVPTIDLGAFDPATDAVVVDLAEVYAGIDVGVAPAGSDMPGCMSFAGDPDCPAMYASFGLAFADEAPPAAASAFSVGTR